MAFFRKAADIFALDIGSSSVKALQLREAGGSYRLTALGTASLPPEAIADGSIKDAPTVIEAIRSSVSKSGIKAKETAIAISGRELIIKKVQIPEVPPRGCAPGRATRSRASHPVRDRRGFSRLPHGRPARRRDGPHPRGRQEVQSTRVRLRRLGGRVHAIHRGREIGRAHV